MGICTILICYYAFSRNGIDNIDRIITTITIQVQAIDGCGVQVGGIVGRDKSAPLGAVVSGVTEVQAGVVIVVVATVTDGVGVCHIVAGGLAGNGAVAPGIVEVLCLQYTIGIIDGNHIALQVPLEVVGIGSAAHSMHHTDDAALVIQEDDVFSGSTLTVVGFDNILGNQAAGMVVVILSAAGGELAQRHRVQAGSTCGIAVATGDALAVTVVTVAVAGHAGESGATGQAGQLALTPCSSLALIGSGTAHGIVANGGAGEAGQPGHRYSRRW